MPPTCETRPLGAAGLAVSSFPAKEFRETKPNSIAKQANIPRNPRAVAAMRRELNLEFLHECAGGIRIHAELIQTFAEIGDVSGTCYALRRLFAHVKAAHPIYAELRDVPASNEGRAP